MNLTWTTNLLGLALGTVVSHFLDILALAYHRHWSRAGGYLQLRAAAGGAANQGAVPVLCHGDGHIQHTRAHLRTHRVVGTPRPFLGTSMLPVFKLSVGCEWAVPRAVKC